MSKSMTSCSNLCLYHLYFSINIVLFFIVLCVTFLIFWQLRNLWVKFSLSFFIQLNFCLSAYKFGCFKTNWTDMKLVSKPYRAIRRVCVCVCVCVNPLPIHVEKTIFCKYFDLISKELNVQKYMSIIHEQLLVPFVCTSQWRILSFFGIPNSAGGFGAAVKW